MHKYKPSTPSTDQHVWAEHYDRPVNDIFAIQTILSKVTQSARANVSLREEAALEERPTKDIKAYNLYYEAASLIDQIASAEEGKEQEKGYLRAMALLTQAIARDPDFVLAYCRLAEANVEFYRLGIRSLFATARAGEIRDRFRLSLATRFRRSSPRVGDLFLPLLLRLRSRA